MNLKDLLNSYILKVLLHKMLQTLKINILKGVQNTSLRILNTLDQVVYEYAIGNISGSCNLDVNMSRQTAGVYLSLVES